MVFLLYAYATMHGQTQIKFIIYQLHQMPPALYHQSLKGQSTSVTQMIFRKSFEVTRIKCLLNYGGLNKHKKITPTYPKDTNWQSHQKLRTSYHLCFILQPSLLPRTTMIFVTRKKLNVVFLLIKDGVILQVLYRPQSIETVETVDCDVTSFISIYSPSPKDLYNNRDGCDVSDMLLSVCMT